MTLLGFERCHMITLPEIPGRLSFQDYLLRSSSNELSSIRPSLLAPKVLSAAMFLWMKITMLQWQRSRLQAWARHQDSLNASFEFSYSLPGLPRHKSQL